MWLKFDIKLFVLFHLNSKDSTNPKSTNNEKHGTFNQKWSVEEQV